MSCYVLEMILKVESHEALPGFVAKTQRRYGAKDCILHGQYVHMPSFLSTL
jgi:hypothetical protein